MDGLMGWICAICGASIAPQIETHCASNSAATGAASAAASAVEQGLVLSSKALSSKPSPKNRFQYNDLAFAEFWNNYPLKRGKEAAQKAWRVVMSSGADAAQVTQAAARYAADPKRDPEHTKYPQGWLNDGRWMDYDTPDEVSHPAAAVQDVDFEDEQAKRWAEEDAAIKALEALDG